MASISCGATVSSREEICIAFSILAGTLGVIALRIELFPHTGGVDVFIALVPPSIDDFRCGRVVGVTFEIGVGKASFYSGLGRGLTIGGCCEVIGSFCRRSIGIRIRYRLQEVLGRCCSRFGGEVEDGRILVAFGGVEDEVVEFVVLGPQSVSMTTPYREQFNRRGKLLT